MEFWARKWGEFFRTTDLHGYKYIVMPGLTIYERVCWAVATVTCLAAAVVLVVITWSWYSYNPTVTIIESTHAPVWESPFPAVTVCDLNLVSRSAAHSIANSWNLPPNMTAEDLFHDLKYVTKMKGTFFHGSDVLIDYSRLQDALDINNVTIHRLFKDLSTPCNRLIRRCLWKNSVYNCNLLFRSIITDEGYCCAFNYLATDPPKDWLSRSVFRTTIPQRVASCGALSALVIVLESRPSDYYSTLYASTGARIFVDNVHYYPDKNSPMRLINPNTELFVAVIPDITYATAGVKSVNLDKRNCYFKHEQKLDNFNHYTYHNCLLECRAYIIKLKCGCIPFYLPNNGTYKTCDFKDLKCLENMRDLYSKPPTTPTPTVSKTMRGTSTTPTPSTPRPTRRAVVPTPDKCRCVPDCEHRSYLTEMATGYFTTKHFTTNNGFLKSMDLTNHSLVYVFYNDLVATKYRHDVYLNWQNLLASFGGLLSLLVGFTFIACFDFFYFFSIRLVVDVFKKKNSDRSVQPRVSNIKNKLMVKKMGAIHVKNIEKEPLPAIDIIWEDLAPGANWQPKPRTDDAYKKSEARY